MRSTYSWVDRARPARTSRDELVTPPRDGVRLIVEYKWEKGLALVCAGILEQDDLAFLQIESRLLCEEQVCTLDNVLKVGFSLCIAQRSNVGYIDGLGASTTRHKQVCLEPQMCPISEIRAIKNDFTSCY